jgi:cytochrome P450
LFADFLVPTTVCLGFALISWPEMTSFLLFSAFLSCTCVLLFLRRLIRRNGLSDIRGPSSPSFLYGHEYEFRNQDEAGDFDFECLEKYGTAWKMKRCFNTDELVLADPLALQHVLHTSGYSYPKRIDANHSAKLVVGDGIVAAIGSAHSRQRKAMNPAFAASQLRTLFPIFQKTADQLCERLSDEAEDAKGERSINLSAWLSKTTLDVIGKAALDYQFHALDETKTEGPFVKAFKNVFADSFLHPPKWDILFRYFWRYLPQSILDLVQYIPTREYKRFRHFVQLAKTTAKDLITEKADDILAEGDSKKDVLTLLVRANMAEDAKHKMNDDEILCQMSTIMLAGHDTTANTMCWVLWELSKNLDIQSRLRAELFEACREHGLEDDEAELSSPILDNLPLLNAVIKECLRMHPIVPNLVREAGKDDVIPLSFPVQTISGKMVDSINVRKGQSIGISICAYNRVPGVWGEDAATWNPDRWLVPDAKHDKVNLGMHANLLSFSAGLRGCIGWRFAVMELQVLVFELISRFEFSPSPEGYEVMRAPAGLMLPMIRDKMEMGLQMPLKVTPVKSG